MIRATSGASALALFAALALSGCAGAGDSSTPQTKTFENPVYDANFPDPFILRAGETYHAYATNNGVANVPTLRSDDLVEWREVGDAMPELAPWVTPGRTWAPEVLAREDGKYVLYYTAASTAAGRQCVGRAVADAPEGPFVDRDEQPLVCQAEEGGSIDASPFLDRDGTLFLLWKNDGNAIGIDTYIYAQEMSSDGLALIGEPVRLIKQDAAWEGALVEAPVMLERGGRYYLFYSGNAFDSEDYAVGYATCDGPLGPCEKAAENPILKSGNGAAGPGHVSMIEDSAGETWVAYHAWRPDAVGFDPPGRAFWLDRLVWRDGRPAVEGPTGGRQTAPL